MTKAIFVLDKMPKWCYGCIFLDGLCECKALGEEVYFDELGSDYEPCRDYRCPLKPMPQKKEVKEIEHLKDFVCMETQYDYITNKIVGKINYDVETIFNEGYNACIDEIQKKVDVEK